MPPDNLPWEKGLAVVFAVALLGIFLDHCYRVLPRCFLRLRRAIENQTVVLSKRQDEQREKLDQIHEAVKHVDANIAQVMEKVSRRRRPPGRRQARAKKPRS